MISERGGSLRPVTALDDVRQAPARPPLVSVVITNYNYGRYLADSVGSALGQAGVEVEVVVVDDASTDDSLRIAGELAEADDRVRVLARPVNGGPVEAFNAGLEAAGGEYVVRLDADDLLTPGSLARATAVAERFPGVGLVYGHPVHFAGAVPERFRGHARSWTVWKGEDWVAERCRLGFNCITSPEVVMRAAVLRRVGGMRPLAHTHDLELWMRIARDSLVAWVGGADQAWHRVHAASLSATKVDVMTDLDERAAAFRTLFADPEDARGQGLLRLALDSLANEALTRATQAYAAGRGGTEETELLVEYARSLRADLDALPQEPVMRFAERIGPFRARFSPYLIAKAVGHRIDLARGRRRWQATGV